ncbi:MAG: PHP domain-containing protein [Planctomycetes bacterium]|nr:PHP domain-containing protein [Planctomycetota bacterium]
MAVNSLNYDLHIHTEYCGHAGGMTVDVICKRADELGLETIAITDHISQPNDIEIIKRIGDEVSRIETNCKVIVGAEVDVDAEYDDGRLVTGALDDIDYVIAGFHYVPLIGTYPHGPDDCEMQADEFMKVWQKSLLGIVSNPKIDTLAHPGRLLAFSVDLDVFFDDALCVFDDAAKLSAKNNIAWEINELTYFRMDRRFDEHFYKISKLALDHGVKLVFGTDSHFPESIGKSEYANNIIERLGAENISTPGGMGLIK